MPTGLPARKGTYSAQDGEKQAPCSHPWRDRRGLLWEGSAIREEPGVLPGLLIFFCCFLSLQISWSPPYLEH